MHASARIADFLARLAVLVLLLAALAAVFIWYLPLIQRNQNLRKEIGDQEARIQALQGEINQMNTRLRIIRGDPNAVTRLVRENLGYASPGEFVIRFDAENPAPATSEAGR